MSTIRTNRDLYVAMAELIKQRKKDTRSLEHYLRAMYGLMQAYGDRSTLTPDEFFEVLEKSFKAEPAPLEEAWFKLEPTMEMESDFESFCHTLKLQIVDLVEMGREGILNNEHRYFGIDAPRGARWFNFDPSAYLECGMAGSWGGWEDGDDTGRSYVPGKVAVLGEDGEWTSVDPQDIESPVEAIEALGWGDLSKFLWAGQYYE